MGSHKTVHMPVLPVVTYVVVCGALLAVYGEMNYQTLKWQPV